MKYTMIIAIVLITQNCLAQGVFIDTLKVETTLSKPRKRIRVTKDLDPIDDRCLMCLNSVWMGSVGFSSQKNNAWELGFRKTSLIRYPKHRHSNNHAFRYLFYSYLYLGAEIMPSNDNKLIPKIGFGYHFILLNAQVSTLLYTNNQQKIEPSLLTELGFSFFGVLQLNYGYQFPVGNLDVNPRPDHRFIIRLAVPIND